MTYPVSDVHLDDAVLASDYIAIIANVTDSTRYIPVYHARRVEMAPGRDTAFK